MYRTQRSAVHQSPGPRQSLGPARPPGPGRDIVERSDSPELPRRAVWTLTTFAHVARPLLSLLVSYEL